MTGRAGRTIYKVLQRLAVRVLFSPLNQALIPGQSSVALLFCRSRELILSFPGDRICGGLLRLHEHLMRNLSAIASNVYSHIWD